MWYYGLALFLGVAIGRLWRWEGGLLAGYVFLVIAETLLIRAVTSSSHFQSELFWSWRAWDEQWQQIIFNVVAFIPIGLLAGRLWLWKGLMVGVGLSAVIETFQLITSRGLCELDDVLHNTLGTAVGVGIVMTIKAIKEECR